MSEATARLEEDRVDVQGVALAGVLARRKLRRCTLECLTVPDQDDTRRALPYRLRWIVPDRTGGPFRRRAARGRDHRRVAVEPARAQLHDEPDPQGAEQHGQQQTVDQPYPLE